MFFRSTESSDVPNICCAAPFIDSIPPSAEKVTMPSAAVSRMASSLVTD